MIRDVSRSTVIIFTVIAVACVASGLAYTAMVINSDNSSSAEYNLVSFEKSGFPATAAQIFGSGGTDMVYWDSQVSGKVSFEFTIINLNADSVSSWYEDGVCVEFILNSIPYSLDFTSASQTTLTVSTPALTPVFDSDDKWTSSLEIKLSDGSYLTAGDFTSGYGLTVKGYHLEAQ